MTTDSRTGPPPDSDSAWIEQRLSDPATSPFEIHDLVLHAAEHGISLPGELLNSLANHDDPIARAQLLHHKNTPPRTLARLLRGVGSEEIPVWLWQGELAYRMRMCDVYALDRAGLAGRLPWDLDPTRADVASKLAAEGFEGSYDDLLLAARGVAAEPAER